MKIIIGIITKLFYLVVSLFLLFSAAIIIIPIIGITVGVFGSLLK